MPDVTGTEYVKLEIVFKTGNASSWTTLNPTLLDGEPGYERDTGKLKIGDGNTDWVNLGYFAGGGSGGGDGFTQEEIEDFIADFIVAGTGVQKNYDDASNVLTISLSGAEFTSVEKTKLSNIEDGAEVNFTGGELVSVIGAELGSTDWQASRTDEEIQDVIGAMITAGTQTNISVTYDDVNNKIDFFVAAATGGGGGLDQEAVEDIIGSSIIGGTGIQKVYDDTAGTLTISLTDERFTITEKNKLAGIEAGAAADQIASDIPIADALNIITAGTVEGAIQELAQKANAIKVETSAAGSFKGTAMNGSNTLFTVEEGKYTANSMIVFFSGQPLTNGNGMVETDPVTGTFTLTTPPQSFDTLIVQFSYNEL